MTREFKTSLDEEFKVSINFRTHKIRVWKKYFGNYVRHSISCYLCKFELLHIAFDMTGDDFKSFLRNDYFSVWN